jgi:hypothetical protein
MSIQIIIHVPPCVCGARPALTRHNDTHLTLRQTCVPNPICMVTSLSLGLTNPATLAYTRNQVTGITPCSLAPYRFRKRLYLSTRDFGPFQAPGNNDVKGSSTSLPSCFAPQPSACPTCPLLTCGLSLENRKDDPAGRGCAGRMTVT